MVCKEQGVGMVPHLQEAPTGPPTGQSSHYNMMKTQLMRKQLQQQEKQRQMEQMNGAQIAECQQVAPFQGRTMPPDCGGYPISTAQQPNPSMVSPLSSNRIVFSPASLSQVGHSGPYMGGTDSKQPFYHPAQDLGMPMRPGQSIMGVGGPPRQPANQGHVVARPGMPGPSLVGSLVPTNHLRQALHQGRSLPPRMMCASQQQPQSQSPLWPNQQGLHPHLDPVNHQHSFPSGGVPPACGGPQFPQRPGMAGMTASFPGARPPPNQIAPNLVGRQMQKMPCGPPLPSMSQQNLRIRGPLSAMAVMKPGGPTMMHPAHGMAPPSYPVASVGKHNPAQGYGPGHNPGHKLTPCDYPPQHQSNGGIPMGAPGPVGGGAGGGGGGEGEVDFIETLVGPNEDWFNNLNMIDEYLEQNS